MPTINPLNVLRESWYFFIHNLRSIALLCLPALLVEGLVRQQLAASGIELAPEVAEDIERITASRARAAPLCGGRR